MSRKRQSAFFSTVKPVEDFVQLATKRYPFPLSLSTSLPRCAHLLPQFTQAHFFIVMFIQHLRRREVEILLRHMHPPFP